MAKYGDTPPFFTYNFFFQNDSEWLEMDFKHNFIEYDILTSGPPPPPPPPPIFIFFFFFFEGVP